MNFIATHKIKNISADINGQEVIFYGWVEDIRRLGKLTFITVSDATGISQVIIKERILDVKKLNKQSVVMIKGIVQSTKSHIFDFEIGANKINILSNAISQLPLDLNNISESHLDTRLNARALDMRNKKTASIFKIRHHVLISIREFLIKQKFIEITTPKIIGSASEGGANLFSLRYFNKNAYLAQSPQLYKEQMIIGLERVFEIASFYRAEKSHTMRHLNEYSSVDIEAAFTNYFDVMQLLEYMINEIYNFINKNCRDEIEVLGGINKDVFFPFKRFTYEQILHELKNEGSKIEFGDDLLDSHLKLVRHRHRGYYFIIDWPLKLKPFYIHEKHNDPLLSQSFDLQYGDLELSSGGTRLYMPEKIKSRLIEQNLNPSDFSDHLKSFYYGMPPHSGWGLGLDRLMMVLTNMRNIREVVLYPRDLDRLMP